jgi:adenylate cyclase
MTMEEFKRKLTTIFSADVEGYSRLMGEDEAGTVKTLTAYREIMAELIKQHRGRVVDFPGDNLLAEFSSVVEAVECAVEIQMELKGKNEELPENRRMEFRIGINLGDVIEEGDRIYGDGVNVAARIEGLADAGGIYISGTVYEQVENKLPLAFEYIGEQSVKNIKKPIRVYRVQVERREADAEVSRELPLPERPSIAVLPFVNMSDDPKQEYFSDGITEEIITALSKIERLFVIARNSSFTYKGKPVKVQQVGRELGVKYVLEGSVRKTEDKVRITAQLVDAQTGNHLWAERYDRILEDIFALQDEITMKIITELQVKLTEGERIRLYSKGTDNLKAYLKFWEATEHWNRMNNEGNAKARNLYEEAIALDPEYPEAYASLGWTHWLDVWLESSRSPRESIRRAFELARKSVALDDSCQPAYILLSNLYLIQRQHEKANEEAEKAIELDPNSADAYALLGQVLVFSGKPEEAVLSLQKAIRLNPIAPSWYWHMIGFAYREMGRYEESITACKKAIHLQPNNLMAYLVVAATYSLLGREDEARAAAAEILRISPKYSLDYLAKTRPHIDPANTDRLIDALRKAGLK